MENYKNNYKNKIIAIVGVSNNEEKYGFKIFKDLVKNNYNVYGVNPKGGEILNRKIYKNLKELKEEVKNIDIVMMVVPPEISEKIVDVCNELNVKEIWFQPGSESEKAIEKAKNYRIKVTANACFMVENRIW